MKRNEMAMFEPIYRKGSRYVWGVKIRKGMKARNLSRDLSVALGPVNDCVLHPLEYRDGAFYFVKWNFIKPGHWPEKTLIRLEVGDWIIQESDGGVSYAKGQFNA